MGAERNGDPKAPPASAWELSADDIRQRQRWARRQGRPGWLWPDVSIDAWRAALGSIAQAVRAVLSGRAGPPVLHGPIDVMSVACYTSGLGPLLGWWCEQGRIAAPPDLAALLALHLSHNRIRAQRMDAAAKAIVGALAAEGIAVVLLKGIHSKPAVFPDPGTRPASDIDLLIRLEDAAATERVLIASGLSLRGRGSRESNWAPADMVLAPRSLMHVHADDPWSIDLHTSLDIVATRAAPVAALDAASPLSTARGWEPIAGARILRQPLLLLHLAAHAGAGMHNLTMLRLVELHLVITQDSRAGLLAWDEFLDLGAACGALGFAFPALRLCEALMPGTVPEPVLAACARHAPPGVRRVIARLSPATAQRVDRGSFAEHFMWARGWRGWARQLAVDLAPDAGSWRGLYAIYERRAWQVLRGGINR